MDHPLLMDDFDEDLTIPQKSLSEEDLYEPSIMVKGDKGKVKGINRKISEFSSSGDEHEQELSSLESTMSASNEIQKNNNNSSSSPIEIKNSPARGKHPLNNIGTGSVSDGKGSSPRSSSSMESGAGMGSTGSGNSRLSIFRVLTRRSSNQGKHKSK